MMMYDETGRHELYEALTSTIGHNPASVLMSYLPRVGWADVATKQDLRMLELRLDADFARLRAELATSQRQQALQLIAAMFTISTLTTIAGSLL